MTEFLKTKEDIKHWLCQWDISSYELIEDKKYGLVVNAKGSVDLHSLQLDFIPVKFNYIAGNFSCARNNLTSLEFAPVKVRGSFNISHNQLTTLKGCPQELGNIFFCGGNQLTSLVGGPKKVAYDYYCDHNQLTSLEGLPSVIHGVLDISENKLTSLKGCSKKVEERFSAFGNQLTTLEFGPVEVRQLYEVSKNQLSSLEFFPKEAKQVILSDNPLLGDIQKEIDFKTLLKIHKEHYEIAQIKKTKNKLEAEIKKPYTQSNTAATFKV